MAPIVLILWTNDVATALAAADAGVDHIGVDLDRIGKVERQSGLRSWISPHTVADLDTLAPVVPPERRFARLNPLHDGTTAEVEALLAAGARTLMLPMFRSAADSSASSRSSTGAPRRSGCWRPPRRSPKQR